MPKFSQKIYRVGSEPCVEVPPRVSDDLGRTGHIPIIGTINDVPFRTTLVPVSNGHHRLYINERMRRDSGVDIGTLAEIVVQVDDEPRETRTPTVLEAALEAHPRAKALFETFPPSHKKKVLDYLNSMDTPEALRENINKLITKLEDSL